ncbi:hypothetical protein PFDSM3638_00975 [Pyrococcus furiosus DSM 3638]|uniref:Glutamate synthase alpha subunit C-terminal domain-containing protein n=3 Tax=Pyrococcus furiosus TaxID=2261 RepID=A0A5C0XMM6_PYRFU|nr:MULTISPECIES: hypothetical protein [Pyrococcus]AAL80330.1 hypothetical protein PF0206 [Pyrococcus furiosus DSM 3638]AFN02994.1 hypothetical protein PFC_00090 [Pyrococcus furiosus COM1]MDK2869214.1 hypothetical protein [Pyrococcus sp.]QEK77932.1 hypothetical protein PFDSM3638_00975 [Pyrococcus furiosus DSM 3638]
MSTAEVLNPYIFGVRPIEVLKRQVKVEGERATIDAKGLNHKEINDLIRECAISGIKEIVLKNVYGQRFIGTRVSLNEFRLRILIHGFPGNDLGAFLAKHEIIVYGNAQDGVGNTMDSGRIIIHGRAGDVLGLGMRGGEIFVRDEVGYRAAIHMKGYEDKIPTIVIGKTAQDFLGEYMAGGRVIVLGLGVEKHRMRYIGTGMHGGKIYIRGKVEKHQLAKEVTFGEITDEDLEILEKYVTEFCNIFGCEQDEILGDSFTLIVPKSKRPYGNLYSGD